MKIAIIGSRGLENLEAKQWLKQQLLDLVASEIISGGNNEGIGKISQELSVELGIVLTEILPDWAKYGKQAAMIRNHEIIKKAALVLAVWDGKSKGTQHEIALAQKYNKPLKLMSAQNEQQSLF